MSSSKPPSVNSSVYNGEYFAGANITKADIGLSLVDNTSDMGKPVSTATTAAISAAVGGVTKASIGLGSVDNTSDLSKPISTLTAAELVLCARLASANTFTNTNLFTGSMSKGRELIAISTTNAVDVITAGKTYVASDIPRIILYNCTAGSTTVNLPEPATVPQGTMVTIINGGDATTGGGSISNIAFSLAVTGATGAADNACTGGGLRINTNVFPTGGTNQPSNRKNTSLATYQTVTFYCIWGATPGSNPSTAWWLMMN